jgi:hypothetical protein
MVTERKKNLKYLLIEEEEEEEEEALFFHKSHNTQLTKPL